MPLVAKKAMHAVNGDGHDDNDKNVSLADDDDGDMILSRCLTVQKAVQYEYIAKLKCLSFNISTEEGDYHVATEIDTEKEKKKRKGESGKSKVFKVSTRGSRRFSKKQTNICDFIMSCSTWITTGNKDRIRILKQ